MFFGHYKINLSSQPAIVISHPSKKHQAKKTKTYKHEKQNMSPSSPRGWPLDCLVNQLRQFLCFLCQNLHRGGCTLHGTHGCHLVVQLPETGEAWVKVRMEDVDDCCEGKCLEQFVRFLKENFKMCLCFKAVGWRGGDYIRPPNFS